MARPAWYWFIFSEVLGFDGTEVFLLVESSMSPGEDGIGVHLNVLGGIFVGVSLGGEEDYFYSFDEMLRRISTFGDA